MKLHFTADQESHLAQLASQVGKRPEQLITEAALFLLEDDTRFREAVQHGLEQADAGNLIEEDEMDRRFERLVSG